MCNVLVFTVYHSPGHSKVVLLLHRSVVASIGREGKIIMGVWGMENANLYTSDILFYFLLPISSVQISFDLSTVVCSGILIELPACIQCSCSNGDQVEFNTFRILQLENQN